MKERLRELLENSYSPIYNYSVAAIVECKDGKTFEGVNVETSSPNAGICAERNALFSAIAAGYKKSEIKNIYIMNKTDKECYPCFVCRQALNDFCDKNTKIITYNYNGDRENIVTLEDLCPYPFSDDDLA